MKNQVKLILLSIFLAPIIIGLFVVPKYGILDFMQYQLNKPGTAKAEQSDVEYGPGSNAKATKGEITSTGIITGPIEDKKPDPAKLPTTCPAGQSGLPPNCVVDPPAPTGITGNWKMIFNDDFDDSGLNGNKWATERSTLTDRGTPYNPATEDGYYTQNNTLQTSGNLELQLKKQAIKSYQYTSGLAQTSHGFGFTYGYVEARIKVPTESNTLPAFWLTTNTTDLRQAPSITISSFGATASPKPIFEYNWLSNNAPQSYASEYGEPTIDYKADYHVYGLLWQANKIQVYIDGKPGPAYTNAANITANKAYIVFNLATKKGTNLPANTKMMVDYIRIWQ